jgi:hypothetical protein
MRRTNKAKFSSIGGYQYIINNSNRVSLTRLCTEGVYISRELFLLILYRSQERLNKTMERKCDYQIKQNNEKENVFAHQNWEYILPKEKRSMMYMIGQQVQKYLDKGAREES